MQHISRSPLAAASTLPCQWNIAGLQCQELHLVQCIVYQCTVIKQPHSSLLCISAYYIVWIAPQLSKCTPQFICCVIVSSGTLWHGATQCSLSKNLVEFTWRCVLWHFVTFCTLLHFCTFIFLGWVYLVVCPLAPSLAVLPRSPRQRCTPGPHLPQEMLWILSSKCFSSSASSVVASSSNKESTLFPPIDLTKLTTCNMTIILESLTLFWMKLCALKWADRVCMQSFEGGQMNVFLNDWFMEYAHAIK